uniref:Peptidase M12B domain-containing protein n=1 Tax=Denticeps clupeoides TaxID=299321 RepID=A0AAY4DAT3_9TELE
LPGGACPFAPVSVSPLFSTFVAFMVSLFTLADHFLKSHQDVSVVLPEKVDGVGQFVSYSVTHHVHSGRGKRDLRAPDTRVYYKLKYNGRDLFFNLTANSHLVSGEHVVERRGGEVDHTEPHRLGGHACHLIGTASDSGVEGTAAVSTCDGLKGFFTLPEGSFLIEPVKGHSVSGEGSHQPHVIYRSAAWSVHRPQRSSETAERKAPCGVTDEPHSASEAEQERESWKREENFDLLHKISKRSISKERWVETLVVADSKLIEYHGSKNVESYIFTIMNMVAGIFHDASIGNAIHIILVRLILLQNEEKDLKIVHHADTTLSSFCAWQKNVNPQSDTHPAHHDVAVLMTRKDICAGKNQPCETLGLSHLSGMCQPHRSCNINEDSGLPVAFTIAHELGHSFGIQHDGQGNDCELDGKHPFVMSRRLIYDSSPLTWSPCSKEYITRFLDHGWGFCLDDRPSKKDLTTPLAAPGVKYTIHHQCQLQYGPNATFCKEVENVCQILWCSVNGSCRSKLDSPIDGTRCGPNKWCISGECVAVGKLPETVNGGWGRWSAWSHCSRTSPTYQPESPLDPTRHYIYIYIYIYERKRYKICNTKACTKTQPTFREMQCSEFDTVPYQNELYAWIPVSSPARPCELHCRPVDEHFAERLLEAVTDGTPCYMNNDSRSICVNGVCKEVGCDFGIDSNAEEDRCGVCLGDGSSCHTVRTSYDETMGDGYVDMVLIPEGARDIFIQENVEAGNFLAVRRPNSDDYFLNGNYIIQWNGEYDVGGAKFYYERSNNLENLTSAGPTKEPVMIQLLFQERNPGITFEYTVKTPRQRGNEVLEPEYTWKHGAWTDCSTTCGMGQQYQPVRCFEVDVGVVDESLCDPDSRPEDRHRECKLIDCPARWWVGGWQPCTATCGPSGLKKRTVLCVRTVDGEERVLHPGDCKHLLKPKPGVPCNRDVPCGSDWAVSEWGEVFHFNVRCIIYSGIESNDKRVCHNPNLSLVCFSLCLFYRIFGLQCLDPSMPPETLTTVVTTTPIILSTASDLLHTDDYDLMLVRSDSPASIPAGRNAKDDQTAGDEGEGSTPDSGSEYPPEHEYVVEDSPEPETSTLTTVVPVRTGPLFRTTVAPELSDKGLHIRTVSTKWIPSTPKPHSGSGGVHTSQAPYQTGKSKKTQLVPRSPQPKKHKLRAGRPLSTTGLYSNFSSRVPVSTDAFWVVGNWSKCSTSCGVGAEWRPVVCSSLQEEVCVGMKKPEPARRCNIQPCTGWHIGDWSKCPEGCSEAARHRDVQCIDTQSKRPLRPFLCQDLAFKPPNVQPCSSLPCLQWRTSPWGKCSKSCGEGQRERLVSCPEHQHCDLAQRPSSTESCNEMPCTQWATEEWGECSKTCGSGLQNRVVVCVDEASGAIEEAVMCEKDKRPDSFQKCNPQECCRKDSMSSRFCEKLKLLGRCVLRSVRKQRFSLHLTAAYNLPYSSPEMK